jgi:thiosulfate dehydrogenase
MLTPKKYAIPLFLLLFTGLLIWNYQSGRRTIPLPGEAEYGFQLISKTAEQYGPGGKINIRSNGMNCTNCHLNAGKNEYAIPLTQVYLHYPRFRERSGTTETLHKRISDCFERSLQSIAPDSNSREYGAIVSYLKWLSEQSITDTVDHSPLSYMSRAADPDKGSRLYQLHCRRCHGSNGEGTRDADHMNFRYPPLWGVNSYSTGAGMYQLSKLARFIKHNMPFDKPAGSIRLKDEEAWDLAAFINSRARNTFDISRDWPVISTKPVDYPFGPYADSFSVERHKYGPWLNMK